MSLLQHNHIFFSVSTLSTKQTSAILNISAVHFTIENGVWDDFTVNISTDSAKKYGLHVNKDTVAYWLTQPEEIREFIMNDQKDLKEALELFDKWVEGCAPTKRKFWSHGSHFHAGILKNAYDSCGMEAPWTHYNQLDSVTLSELIEDTKLSENERNMNPLKRTNIMASKIVGVLHE